MKKIIIMIMTLTILASAKYEVFKSQTQSIGSAVKTEVVFFGKYDSFGSKLSEGSNDGLTLALIGGITGGLSTGAIYGVIGFLDPIIMDMYADQKYLKVTKLTDSNGRVAFKKVLFIGDKHPTYSDTQINQLMK